MVIKRWFFNVCGMAAGLLLLSGCASVQPNQRQEVAPTAHRSDIHDSSRDPAASQQEPLRSGSTVPALHSTETSQPTVAVVGTTSEVATENLAGSVILTAAPAVNLALSPDAPQQAPVIEPSRAEIAGADIVPINLPTTLAMVGGQHPVVGFARWRVQEAYAQLERAKVMWLPSIQTGFNYRRRDGNYQAVGGEIVDVNLNSFNYGLGTGAVAAGSPTQPGIVAEFHLADALFLPHVAEKTAWARSHAANATLNQQLLNAALAYYDLLEAQQDLQIVSEAEKRTTEAAKITTDYAEAGEGLQSDADRVAADLALLQTRALSARERQLIASTRLARELSIPMTSAIVPQDALVVPIDWSSEPSDESTLIATGLAMRPELKESQALVAAACEAFKREKYAPFVPSVLLGFSSSTFGGGLGSHADNFDNRYDIDAMMVWELRNLGLGERAARKERNSQIQQATFTKLRIMDQVAQEVAEANAQVTIRRQQIEVAQEAIRRARDSYNRNMDRIRDGQGLPIEVLQAIQALEATERAYLRSVIDYNRAQLQLQWALGWPVNTEDAK